MKIGITFLAIIHFFSISFSQTRVDKCYIGTCIIDFGVEPFQVISSNAVASRESPASICDEQGNLLFYTNGGPSPTSSAIAGIWDASGVLLQNALPLDSAGCVSSYSGATIVPFPSVQKAGSLNYYIFTKDCVESAFSGNNYNSGLSVSIVDMSLNNDLGAVISKHQTVVPFEYLNGVSTSDEPLAIVSQSNDIDYWLYSYTNGSFYKLPITTAGIGSPIELFPASEGRIVFSPSRNFVILGSKLYSYDLSTGDLTYVLTFSANGQSAFSSDGSKLYRLEGGTLAQYDVTNAAILSSRISIFSNMVGAGQIFLTANSSIYISGNESSFIYAQIRCPNTIGLACDFRVINQSLNGGFTGSNSFINFPADWLYQQTSGCFLSLFDHQIGEGLVQISQTLTELNLTSNSEYSWKFKLINSIGISIVQDKFSVEKQILTESLKDGMYYLVLESEEGNHEVQPIFIHH